MPRFFIALSGGSKHDPSLLQPCGSYQFLYDADRNEHLLEGGALTLERFNEAAADMIRRWPSMSMYRLVPRVEMTPDELGLAERVESQQRTIDDLKRKLGRKLEAPAPS
jgi:hypothetical protein